jgi:arylsulfatase A-like enzyme
VPLITGGSIMERPLFWHYPHYGNQGGEPSSIIRRGEWKLIHYYEDDREELYNLNNDPYETKNVAKEYPELVSTLSKELLAFLDDTGAIFPVKDPEYSADKESEYLEKIINEKWPQLEKQRLHYLSDNYDPGNNWWGSQP